MLRRLALFSIAFLSLATSPLRVAAAGRDLSVVPTHGELANKTIYHGSYALLIGIDSYPHFPGQLQLQYADKDALAMRDVLIRSYGFPPGHIRMLLNTDATRERIESALSDFADQDKYTTDDRILVYFSGHGQTVNLPGGGEMGFLIPSDADVQFDHIDNAAPFLRTCVEMETVWSYLQSTPAKHVLLIADACYSGLLAQNRALGISPGALAAMASRRALQVMTAGGKGETSTELSDYGHGAFTYKLLEELKARASVGPGEVFTSSELYSAVERSVSNLTDGAQEPQFGNYKTEGNFLFITTAPQPTSATATIVPRPAPKPKTTARPLTKPTTKPGGANQIDAVVTGKIGDDLFDGRWRFKVVSIETAQSYNYNTEADWNTATRTLTATAGNTLLIVRCQVANGQNTKQTLWIANQGSNTSVTNDQGEAFPSCAHDFTGAPIQSKALIPGSKMLFPVVFAIPQGTVPADLIFTLRNNDGGKGSDVRVSLR